MRNKLKDVMQTPYTLLSLILPFLPTKQIYCIVAFFFYFAYYLVSCDYFKKEYK